MESKEKWYLDIRGTCFVVLAIEQMMMNADTGISEVASAVKRQGWMQVSHADEGRTGLLPAGQAMHSELHARVAKKWHRDAGTGTSEMDGDEYRYQRDGEMRKMVSQWRYRCACYRTARHASAPAAHATQSVSASLPVDDAYFPAAHGCLSLEPTGQKKPAGQI